MKKRDWVAALTLLECDKKYSQRHDLKTYMSIAYCAFHNGDYKKAMEIYDELMKRADYDRNLHAYKAACMYALCNYKDAKIEAQNEKISSIGIKMDELIILQKNKNGAVPGYRRS